MKGEARETTFLAARQVEEAVEGVGAVRRMRKKSLY